MKKLRTFIFLITAVLFTNSCGNSKADDNEASSKKLKTKEEADWKRYALSNRVADSVAAEEAMRVQESNRVEDSIRAIKAIRVAASNRVEDSIRALKEKAIQGEEYLKRFDKKNLNVSKYRNGEVIPQVQDPDAWAGLTTGAWCYYNNDATNGKKYGKLYNWYAVNDPRGLAPARFHIATKAEWTELIDYLGGEEAAATKMKSRTGWHSYGNGSNSSGFAGFPGGYRGLNGTFVNIGRVGHWWSERYVSYSSADKSVLISIAEHAWCSKLDENYDLKHGFSVRCIKD